MTFAEFEFWEKCMAAALSSGGMAPSDAVITRAADIADAAINVRRTRAAKVIDYHGEGLYTNENGAPSLPSKGRVGP